MVTPGRTRHCHSGCWHDGGRTATPEPMAELRHAEIHGHRMGYRMAGEGPTVVLLHGMAGSCSTWRDVMPVLARDHRVLAPDLLGHGASDRPHGDYTLAGHANRVRDLLVYLGVERATIVGQSLGGGVAMQAAYQHPELCERLVLVSSGGLGREVSWMLRALTLPGAELVLPVIAPAFVAERGEALNRWLVGHGIRAARVGEMWSAYRSLADGATRQAFLRTLRAVVDPGGQSISAVDRLYLAAAVPTQIVWGDADPIIPVSHAHAAHEATPGSRLEVLEGVGHFPQVERPERVAQILVDFIAETEPAARSAADFRDLLVPPAC